MLFPLILFILTTFISALLAMAFYTLLERKILGYIQLRKGPNKVSLMGILQPFADALKLLSKELKQPSLANFSPFLMAPMLSLFLSLMLWNLTPIPHPSWTLSFGVLAFLCISSLNVYSTLAAGWTSNSKYSLIGSLRSIAQTISYEVSMVLILISILLILSSLSFNSFLLKMSIPFIILPISLFTWFITLLAETNRTPFDFPEGESELVSGFNTEYSSGSFAMIFMAEYMSIIIMSLLSASIFMILFNNIFLTSLMSLTISIMFIWARGTLPRMRYDQLMNLTWKSFLPFSLSMIIFISSFIV